MSIPLQYERRGYFTQSGHKKGNMNRRDFISSATLAAATLGLPAVAMRARSPLIRIGVIGLDTSHAPTFIKYFNVTHASDTFRVVAAYPHGSADIPSSVSRIPKYTEEVKTYGVEIVDSIAHLLRKTDAILLETNDGRLHKAQAFEVMRSGKPMFIDKPVAASFADVQEIYKKARALKAPVFSASSLRYMTTCQQVTGQNAIGNVLGADTFCQAALEPSHVDLFWYGIHGVEILFTVMGTGCESVTRYFTNDMEVVVGQWRDGRLGTFRGTRAGKYDYGGTVFGSNGNIFLGRLDAYDELCVRIGEFFTSGKSPVDDAETLEIYAFMQAADESRKNGGKTVRLKDILKS